MSEAKKEGGGVADLAVDVAKFYGGLVSNGVPANQACSIAGQYVQTRLLERMAAGLPPRREPWED